MRLVSGGRNTFAYVGPSGERLVSVTEALKLAGLVDFSQVNETTLERARERGQDVHAWVEGLATGLLDDEEPDPRIAPYVEAYRRFVAETGFVATASEQRVVHATYGYAGTIDLLGSMAGTGGAWLLDIKATAAIPPEARPQTAAYRMAHLVTGGDAARRRGVLHLRPDGTYRLDEHKHHREDEQDFLAALRIARWKIAHGRARLEE